MNKLLSIILVLLLCMSFISAATMTRTGPSTAESGKTFQITYQVTGTGTWGASITDSVTGGCKFPDGTSSYKDVMLSSSGNTRTITITAPSSGSCAFSGDYKFGIEAIKTFPSLTTTISTCTDCDDCTFKISTFCVKLWMIIALVIAIILLFVLRKK
jgi:hypothetical protein